MIRLPCLVAALLLIAPFAVEAEEPAVPEVTLALTPADEPVPALRFRFFPPSSDQTEGNAATFYYRALLIYRSAPDAATKELLTKSQDWLDLPAEQFPRDDARKLLDATGGVVEQLRTAARCGSCRWDFQLHTLRGAALVGFVLPEMQELRNLARLLAVRARLAILEGRFDEAIETLGLGYRLSIDAAQEPLLITGLIGLSCAQMMNARLAEFSQQPGAPNLYWALSALPRPLVDIGPAMEFEMSWINQIFPVLRDASTARRTAAQWESELEGLFEMSTRQLEPMNEKNSGLAPAVRKALLMAQLKARLPESRKRLVERGRKAEDVEKMPDAQVALIDAAETYAFLRDEWFKWSLFPFHEAYPRMAATEERLKKEGWLGAETKEPIPLASVLLPAVVNVKVADIRMQRSFAEARLIEALRLHAGRNGNRLPKSLSDVTAVIVPDDPVTGKPFDYRLDKETAVIHIAPPAKDPPQRGKVYRITVRGK